jgi:hypothetical protein
MRPDYVLRAVHVDCSKQKDLSLEADVAAWFSGWDRQKEKSIMIPGPAATVIANRYAKMFDKP